MAGADRVMLAKKLSSIKKLDEKQDNNTIKGNFPVLAKKLIKSK